MQTQPLDSNIFLPNPKINQHMFIETMEKELILEKQKIVFDFYKAKDQKQKLLLIQKWPTLNIKTKQLNQFVISRVREGWYFGDAINNLFHGHGILIYQQSGEGKGRFYEGQFQNNCKHGRGFEYLGGDIYIGNFVNNKPEDENGVFLWSKGDLFMGGFVNGVKHGFGKWQSGSDTYEGTWKLNRPEGYGKINTLASNYEGEVRSGYKHGSGNQSFSNGDQYSGLYGNGKPEGLGLYKWNNGAIYKGQFQNGIRHGRGRWEFGGQIYQGQYVNDKRCGKGIYQWTGNSYYKGEFLDDLRHGFGQMHWNEKSFYKGQWIEGMQEGYGQIWENGIMINKGIFKKGKMIVQEENDQLQKSNPGTSNKSFKINRSHMGLTSTERDRNKGYFSDEKKSSTTRYPDIGSKQKNRISSLHKNLGKIEELPKLKKDKKYITRTAFSNHIKDAGNTSTTLNRSHQSRAIAKEGQGQIFHKNIHKRQNSYDFPSKLPLSKLQEVHTNSPKQFFAKRKVQLFLKQKSLKEIEIEDDSQVFWKPITWKNFNHLKARTTEHRISDEKF